MARLKRLLWSILFVSSVFHAQEDTIFSVRKFPENLTVRAAYLNTSNEFNITDLEEGASIRFKPNTRQYLGLSVLFRSVELDFGFAPGFLRDNRDNENSKLFTLNFRMFLGKWMQAIDFYQQHSFTAILNGQQITLPDVKTLKIGGSTSYIFNEYFSFRAISFQNEWQRKSAGSFIPRLTYYYTDFNWDLGEYENRIQSFDIAAGPGYFYNLVIDRNFILSLGGNVGAGVNYSKDDTESLVSFLFESNIRTALGYNSERFFTGVNTNLILLAHSERRAARLDDEILFFEVYLGYRFDAPRKFIEWADKINSKFGL